MIRNRSGLLRAVMVFLAVPAALAGAAQAGQNDEFYVRTHGTLGDTTAIGVRAAGMGGAQSALADGVASVGQNPAGLGAFSGKGVGGGYGFDWLDDGLEKTTQTTLRLGGAMSLGEWLPETARNQSVGVLYKGTDFSGASSGGMKRNQGSLAFAYGHHLMDDLLGGVSIALFDGEFGADRAEQPFDRTFRGGEFRVGGIYRLADNFTAGGSMGYATGSYNSRAAPDRAAASGSLGRWSVQGGVAYQLDESTLIAGDVQYANLKTELDGIGDETNKLFRVSAGIERQVLPERLALRGGLYYANDKYSSSGEILQVSSGSYGKSRLGFTAGAGVRLKSFDIGYALDIDTGGDIKNTLDISAEW